MARRHIFSLSEENHYSHCHTDELTQSKWDIQ
ncbi:Uncharacterised protein [Klebsiella michiganensis]|uniref:Uncharacterized protein n=1 Tax=Klebsiella michiganensis TaxID=1134687 RepID=A0A7H4MZZ5_9ENTR|nr:Uncharacterised protein [Klebsiella michiganensis]